MNEKKACSLFDTKFLATQLKRSFHDPKLSLIDWQITRITGGVDAGSTIYRLSGKAESKGQEKNWSMIMKQIQTEEAFSDPNSFHYWKREIQVYQSKMIDHLPGNFSTPKIYSIQKNPDGSYCIFMEDVQDEFRHPWPISQFIDTAYQLGRFNGAYLVDKSLPDDRWVSRNWLRKYLIYATPMVDFIKQNPDQPVVKSLLPGLSLPMTLSLWDAFPRLIERLDELPQTFCHQDAFTRNLFYQNGKLIAIDWGYAGIAPVGAELAPLIGVAFDYSGFPSNRAEELDQACFERYLDGLRDSGYTYDRQNVRLGFGLTMTLRYVLGAVVGGVLPKLLDKQGRKDYAEAVGVSEDEASENKAEVVNYYQKIAMESLTSLGMGFSIQFVVRTILWAIRISISRMFA